MYSFCKINNVDFLSRPLHCVIIIRPNSSTQVLGCRAPVCDVATPPIMDDPGPPTANVDPLTVSSSEPLVALRRCINFHI